MYKTKFKESELHEGCRDWSQAAEFCDATERGVASEHAGDGPQMKENKTKASKPQHAWEPWALAWVLQHPEKS